MYLLKAFILSGFIISAGYGVQYGAELAEYSLNSLVRSTYDPSHFPADAIGTSYRDDMRTINQEYVRATAR